MSYQLCVNGLAGVLKTIPDFSKGNITAADYRVIGAGFAQSIVLFPGSFSIEESTLGPTGDYWIDWEIRIELFVRYSTEPEIATRIAALRQLIVNKLFEYPKLNGTSGVIRALINRGDAPAPVFGTDNQGPMSWLQVLHCSVLEDANSITAVE